MLSLRTVLHLILTLGFAVSILRAAPDEPTRIGVLQATPAQAPSLADAGVTLTVLSVSWDRFEPTAGAPDKTYIRQLRADAQALAQETGADADETRD